MKRLTREEILDAVAERKITPEAAADLLMALRPKRWTWPFNEYLTVMLFMFGAFAIAAVAEACK